MTLDLKAMKEAAEAASSGRVSGGQWSQYEDHPLVIVNADGSSLGDLVPGDPYITGAEALANAAFIAAACPANVLALIALLEEAREALEPFAAEAVAMLPDTDDDEPMICDLAAISCAHCGSENHEMDRAGFKPRDLRRARAILSRIDAAMGAGGEE